MAKTESKGKAAGSALLPAVSPEKIIKGMTTIFQGFSIMFDGMAEQMQQMEGMAEQQISTESADKAADGQKEQADTAAGDSKMTEEELPFEAAPEDKKSTAAITVDDLLKVAAQKITMNRKNSPKIKALLTSYGCGAISELPEDKREAFLNDLAQL